MSKRNPPTRAELKRLSEDFDALVSRQAATQKELAIQFQRIADLQAELDVIRAAWSKMKAKGTVKRSRAR